MPLKDNETVRKGKGHGYYNKVKNIVCMVRCFFCGKENYSAAVSSGFCAWCGNESKNYDTYSKNIQNT